LIGEDEVVLAHDLDVLVVGIWSRASALGGWLPTVEQTGGVSGAR
jgi:hypothetical protein